MNSMHPRAAILHFSEHPARRRAQNRVFRAEIVPPQMAGFWGSLKNIVQKAAPIAGAAVGAVAGGPGGAAAGYAAGTAVSAVLKGQGKEAVAAAEQATGYDIPPAAEAIAQAVIGNGGSVEDAAAEVSRRVLSGQLAGAVRRNLSKNAVSSSVTSAARNLAAAFKGESVARDLGKAPKFGLASGGFSAAEVPSYAGSYETRALTPAAAPAAGLPPWAMYAGGAVVVGGLVYLATRKGGR